MREAGWSARRLARQLGRSDCVVRRCWDQWVQEMSFTRPGSERLRQTSHREDSHIVRNTRLQPTASSAAIQAQPFSPLHANFMLKIECKYPWHWRSEWAMYQDFFVGPFFRYERPVSGTIVTHLGAPVAWVPHIIDTAVATPLTLGYEIPYA
ncbi:uncharacterized protein TNCV_4485101 [Trichonephila clavipes]|nr:uncharacterized protein TNCV_4485101 [Trichonephila clavipes]